MKNHTHRRLVHRRDGHVQLAPEPMFDEQKQHELITILPRCHGNITRAAQCLKVSYRTVYRHIRKSPELSAQVKEIRRGLAGTLEETAYECALKPIGVKDRWRLLESWAPEDYAPSGLMIALEGRALIGYRRPDGTLST